MGFGFLSGRITALLRFPAAHRFPIARKEVTELCKCNKDHATWLLQQLRKEKKIRLFGTGRNSQYALVRVLSVFSPRFVRVLSAFKTTTMERCIYKNNSFHVHLWTTELHTTSSTIANRSSNTCKKTTLPKVQLALNLRLRKLNIFLTQCWSSRVKTLRVLYLMLLWFTHTLKSRSERKPNTRLL